MHAGTMKSESFSAGVPWLETDSSWCTILGKDMADVVLQQMQQLCSVILTLEEEMTTPPQQKSQIINFSSQDVTSFHFFVPCFALIA